MLVCSPGRAGCARKFACRTQRSRREAAVEVVGGPGRGRRGSIGWRRCRGVLTFATADGDDGDKEGDDKKEGEGGDQEDSADLFNFGALEARIAEVKKSGELRSERIERNIEGGSCTRRALVNLGDWVRCLRAAGDLVAIGTFGGAVLVYDLTYGTLVKAMDGGEGQPPQGERVRGEICSLDFDGRYCASGSVEGRVKVHDVMGDEGVNDGESGSGSEEEGGAPSGVCVFEVDLGTDAPVGSVALLPSRLESEADGQDSSGLPEEVASASGRAVYLLSPDGRRVTRELKAGAVVTSVGYSEDGYVCAGLQSGFIQVFTRDEQPREVLSFRAHPSAVRSLCVSGSVMYSGAENGEIAAWDLARGGRIVASFMGHRGPVVALSASDGRLASGAHDGTVRLWDSAAGKQLYAVGGHTVYLCAVDLDAQNGRLLADGTNNVVVLHDFAGGTDYSAPGDGESDGGAGR